MLHPDDEERLSAYFDGELSAAERGEVERLLREDPAARAWWEHLADVRAELEVLPEFLLEADFAEAVLRRAEREMLLEPLPDLHSSRFHVSSTDRAARERAALSECAALRDSATPRECAAPSNGDPPHRNGTSVRLDALSAPSGEELRSEPSSTRPLFTACNGAAGFSASLREPRGATTEAARWQGSVWLAAAASLLLMAGVLFSDAPHRDWPEAADRFSERASSLASTQGDRNIDDETIDGLAVAADRVRPSYDAYSKNQGTPSDVAEFRAKEYRRERLGKHQEGARRFSDTQEKFVDEKQIVAENLRDLARDRQESDSRPLGAPASHAGGFGQRLAAGEQKALPIADDASQGTEVLAYMQALPAAVEGAPRVVVLDVEQDALARVEQALGLRPADGFDRSRSSQEITSVAVTSQPMLEYAKSDLAKAPSQLYQSTKAAEFNYSAATTTARVYFVSLPPAEWALAFHEAGVASGSEGRRSGEAPQRLEPQEAAQLSDRQKSAHLFDDRDLRRAPEDDKKKDLAQAKSERPQPTPPPREGGELVRMKSGKKAAGDPGLLKGTSSDPAASGADAAGKSAQLNDGVRAGGIADPQAADQLRSSTVGRSTAQTQPLAKSAALRQAKTPATETPTILVLRVRSAVRPAPPSSTIAPAAPAVAPGPGK